MIFFLWDECDWSIQRISIIDKKIFINMCQSQVIFTQRLHSWSLNATEDLLWDRRGKGASSRRRRNKIESRGINVQFSSHANTRVSFQGYAASGCYADADAPSMPLISIVTASLGAISSIHRCSSRIISCNCTRKPLANYRRDGANNLLIGDRPVYFEFCITLLQRNAI